MGVDACIRFGALRDGDNLNDVAFELARIITGDAFYKHPCIEFREGADDDSEYEDNHYHVMNWSRYYGPGYERGDWPTLRAMLVWLNARVDGAEYAGDNDLDWRPATEVIAKNDDHWLKVGYPYRWTGWHNDELPSGCTRPVDVYGKQMIRYGFGGGYAAFSSIATTEKRTWRDGGWVDDSEVVP